MSLYDLFSEWFYYDDQGNVYWKKTCNQGIHAGDRAGNLQTDGYWRVQIRGQRFAHHLIVYTMHHGEVPEGYLVDHIDGNPTNNTPSNLRLATYAQNQWNARGKGKSKGVHKSGDRFKSSITVHGNKIHLGYFDTADEAKAAYEAAALKYYGEFARFD